MLLRSSSSSGLSAAKKPLIIAAVVAGAIALILIIVLPSVLLTRSFVYVPPPSAAGRLLVLTDSSSTRADGSRRIAARSYDGNPWEALPDEDNTPVTVDCSSSPSCAITTRGSYFVEELPVPSELLSPTADQLAARLFVQAAFGASRADLADFAASFSGNATAWVLAQQALPATSHRAYLRRRVNLRQSFPTCGPICPTSMGVATVPCDIGSRWNRYLFSANDQPGYGTQTTTVTIADIGTAFTLSVNNVVRGEVASFLGNAPGAAVNLTFPVDLVVCTVVERVGGTVQLSFPNKTCITGRAGANFSLPNPAIVSPHAPSTRAFALSEATFASVAGKPDSLILQSLAVACTGTPSFMTFNGSAYAFDSRLKLQTNTLTSPVTGAAATATVGCPNPAKDFSNSATCVRSPSCTFFESCGSVNEVPNDPTLGARFLFSLNNQTTPYNAQAEWNYPTGSTKALVWLNAVYSAPDQLRQRTAWALSQIFTLGAAGLNFDAPVSEPFAQYYDIFVRNAFGSYRDLLREVSYSPVMAQYLTYWQNQAFSVGGSYPDENYAREVMQLFAIGLWKLNNDGTQILDGNGEPMATYTNEDILSFSRVWTGFNAQASRSNIESPFGKGDTNFIDPMQINAAWRDNFPKAQLDDGYLGDRYPLCDQLPPVHWLKPGAQFIYTGSVSIEGATVDAQSMVDVGLRGRLTPSSATSVLFQTLCAPDSSNRCTYPSRVTLTQPLACDGDECNAGRVTVVRIIDPVSSFVGYYTYQSVPCVRLPFFDLGRRLKAGSRAQCANPVSAIAYPVCCDLANPTTVRSNYTSECLFANEAMNYATAAARCTALNRQVCNQNVTSSASWARTCAPEVYMWTTGTCRLQAQVYVGGQVGIVDTAVVATGGASQLLVFNTSSGNSFRVRWKGENFPAPDASGTSCGTSACRVVDTARFGATCLCDLNVSVSAVFTDTSVIPTPAVILSSLNIGAAVPSSFGAGVYVQCTNATCNSAAPSVIIWTRGGAATWDKDTIFQLAPLRAGGAPVYLLNQLSLVSVGTEFAFRNPPHVMPLVGQQPNSFQQWTSYAMRVPLAALEVEMLIDHLFWHPSLAPFVSKLMIQRMVTSNPSPRYVSAVATAFRTGTYGGRTFSGVYGDMGAAVAAIVLDREARSVLLEADPSFGVIREPLLRVIHVLRAMNYQGNDARELIMPSLSAQVGMEAFGSPSVFGFYLPLNRPDGFLNNRGMVSPEAQIATTPPLIGLINGLASLVDNGLSSCNSGFGFGSSCSAPISVAGALQYASPASATTAAQVIDDLDLLLTSGRLNSTLKAYVIREYSARLAATNSTVAALKYAQKMILLSTEFHTTNANLVSNVRRPVAAPQSPLGRPPKNIVVLFMNGGLDSYNLLVPDTGCALFDEYTNLRTSAALNASQMLSFAVPAGSQPCANFAIHSAMPNLRTLVQNGEAAFVANVGPMIVPVSKADFLGTSGLKKKFPPSLFAHNAMQSAIQNGDPANLVAKGILGRAVSALQAQGQPWDSALYSLSGSSKMIEGAQPLDFIDSRNGFPAFYNLNVMQNAFNNLTLNQSSSYFGETFSGRLQGAIQTTTRLNPLLSATTLNISFATPGTTTTSSVGAQFAQVAKMIKLQPQLMTERSVFVTQVGGFDTHNSFNLVPLLSPIDNAFTALAAELKIQGVWDNTVVITISDFGRTLTSNGQGTDHSWGGNNVILGGGLNGGKIFGQFPITFAPGNSLDLGRGRQLPTVPWEAVWNGVLQWFGVTDAQMATVLPNAKNFPASQLFTRAQLFKN